MPAFQLDAISFLETKHIILAIMTIAKRTKKRKTLFHKRVQEDLKDKRPQDKNKYSSFITSQYIGGL